MTPLFFWNVPHGFSVTAWVELVLIPEAEHNAFDQVQVTPFEPDLFPAETREERTPFPRKRSVKVKTHFRHIFDPSGYIVDSYSAHMAGENPVRERSRVC